MSGQVAVFAGSTPNIGTTVTALGTAYRLASATGKRVGFLCLNLKSAKTHLYLGVDKPQITLDGLRPELRADAMTGDKLLQYMHASANLGGLRVLFGNLAREQAEYYEPDDIKRLLAASRDAFELTIADVSAYWDNAATICAMQEADYRYLVTTRYAGHFHEDIQRWTGQVGGLFGLKPDRFQAVVLHHEMRGTGGYGMKEIRKEIGCQMISELKLLESLHLQLDSGRLDEWLSSQQRHAQSFDSVAGPLMNQLNWRERLGRRQMPWMRRLMLHRERRK